MAGINGTDITNPSATVTSSNYEICQRSGFRVPAGSLVREWDGRKVREESYEARHDLDRVRTRALNRPRGTPAPEPQDQFIENLYPNGVSAGSL